MMSDACAGPILRAVRLARSLCLRSSFHQRRCQSSQAKLSLSPKSNHGSHLFYGVVGGVVGGGAVVLGGYSWYHFSGAKGIVDTTHQTTETIKSYFRPRRPSTSIDPTIAISFLRTAVKSYCAPIPGASILIDCAFDDIDSLRHKHQPEIDKIIREAYAEVKEFAAKETNITTASALKVWDILQKYIQRIAGVAGNAGRDMIDRYPALKSRVGISLERLKEEGEKHGLEGKRQVEEALKQVQESMRNGMRAENTANIQAFLQQKAQQIQKNSGSWWENGLETTKSLFRESTESEMSDGEKENSALRKEGETKIVEKGQEGGETGEEEKTRSIGL